MTEEVKVFVAGSYRKGVPTNAMSVNVGYGLTPEQAVQLCEPWANQAAWFIPKARFLFAVKDGEKLSELQIDVIYSLIGYFEEKYPDWRSKPATTLKRYFAKYK